MTPSRLWFMDEIHEIVKASIVLHNMIIRETGNQFKCNYSGEAVNVENGNHHDFENVAVNPEDQFPILSRLQDIRDQEQHFNLKNELIDNMWNLKGNGHL